MLNVKIVVKDQTMTAQRERREKMVGQPGFEMAELSNEGTIRRRFIDYPTHAQRVAALDSWLSSLPKHAGTNISDESLRRENLYEDRA